MNALASRAKPFHLRDAPLGKNGFLEILSERGLSNAEAIAKQLISGTGSQLRGAPLLALSAKKIYRNYPELRDEQLNYFNLDCAEGHLALTQAPAEFAGCLVDAHLAMNGATSLVADYLFEITNFYKPYSGTSSDALATSARSFERPMSDNAVLSAMRRMGISKEEMCGHGFRATARTLLDEELGYRPDLIEQQLAHVQKDPNGRAYNRTKHLVQRREMMQCWARLS